MEGNSVEKQNDFPFDSQKERVCMKGLDIRYILQRQSRVFLLSMRLYLLIAHSTMD